MSASGVVWQWTFTNTFNMSYTTVHLNAHYTITIHKTNRNTSDESNKFWLKWMTAYYEDGNGPEVLSFSSAKITFYLHSYLSKSTKVIKSWLWFMFLNLYQKFKHKEWVGDAPYPHPDLSPIPSVAAAGVFGLQQSPAGHKVLTGHQPPALLAQGTWTVT